MTFILFAACRPDDLSPDVIFTAIGLFSLLNAPMQNIPTYMNNLFSANVTVARVAAILHLPLAPCITRNTFQPSSPSASIASVVDIAACTTPNRLFQRPFALQLQRGCNAVVVGRVGCGKSTLLQIVAGECDIGTSSSCQVTSRTLYVPQEPQLFKGSIRENICLGEVYDETKLQHALWASCLVEDIEALEHGLQSDVGTKGSNLSGGQRARVSIARVLYHVKEDDVLLLDDVFAALDEQTFKHLVKRMFTSSSIPESVTVVLTCARGLICHRPLRSIRILDSAITMLPSSQLVFEGSPLSHQSPRHTSQLSSSLLPGAACNNLKALLDQLECDSRLPEHTLSRSPVGSDSKETGAALVREEGAVTRLVDWRNLAV
jgi:ABC-type bacteriocin/lantibiotic exporter with double-glycine peptidase domain